MFADDDVTADWLQKEISEANHALAQLKSQQHELLSNPEDNNTDELLQQDIPVLQKQHRSPLQRLMELQDSVQYLQLANDIVQCQKEQKIQTATTDNKNHVKLTQLEEHVRQCERISNLLCRHPPPVNPNSHYGKLIGVLWQDEYQPLYTYTRASIILSLRKLLQQSGYPAMDACSKLLLVDRHFSQLQGSSSPTTTGSDKSTSKDQTFSLTVVCQLLTSLQLNHQQVIQHIVVATNTGSVGKQRVTVVDKSYEIVVVELLRPIVERVQYHFVEKRLEKKNSQPGSSSLPQSKDQPPQQKPTGANTTTSLTISRLDHLPEWIITYIRDHVLKDGGPWDIVRLIVARHCVGGSNNHPGNLDDDDDPRDVLIYFLNEVVRLIQWVLIERNFFRHSQIAGPPSNPIFLNRAIEQLMTLDAELRDILPAVVVAQQQQHQPQQQRPPPVLLRLTDIMLAHDEDLMQWWLEREREFALSTLFDNESIPSESSIQLLWQPRIAPRAELFCVLLRSIQAKAANFTMPGPYLAHVAVPLCVQFVDAIHETSKDLRSFLGRRKLPDDAHLRANLLEWMDLINGTYLSASVLLKGRHVESDFANPIVREGGVDHDLHRIGRSLDRLQIALVDEFGSVFVETLLMERAKLASYLMQAPFLLSHAAADDDEEVAVDSNHDEISVELQPVKSFLDLLVHVCDLIVAQVDVASQEANNRETMASTSIFTTWDVAKFAAHAMKQNVMNRLAEKFLEIILDEGMVPEIVEVGARKFAWNLRAIFGENRTGGPLMDRLMDIISFLSIHPKQLWGLKSALMDLTAGVGSKQWLLDARQLAADGTIYDEAVSMIRAKGFASLDLEDVVSILNRRKGIVV